MPKQIELILIGTRQQVAKITIDDITVGHFVIAPQSPVRNLGVWLDSNLSMGDHIRKTSSAAFYYLYNTRSIKKYLSKECTETLIHASLSIVIACYMAYRCIRFRNCKESRTLLRALYSKKVNFVLLHHC